MSTHTSIHQYTSKTMNNPIHSVYAHEKGDKCKQFINELNHIVYPLPRPRKGGEGRALTTLLYLHLVMCASK